MATSLPCDRLLIGMSGSVHSAHLPQYLVLLRREFAREIRLIATRTALTMVSERALEVYSNGPVHSDIWGADRSGNAPHVELGRWAEVFAIVPATADVIGKIANGIADDLLTTTALMYDGPIVIAPAMNPTMWQRPSVRRNVDQLRADGHYVIDPTDIASVTTTELGQGLGPTPESLLPHLWHIRMRELRQDYWPQATAEAPRSPAAERDLLQVVRS